MIMHNIQLLILLPGQDINNAKAVVPWKELLSRSEEYVGAKYLPADHTLMDPSHIHADDVICLLDHWYAWQAKMKPLLQFHQVVPPGHAVSSGPLHPNPRIAKNTSSEDDTDASCSDGVAPKGHSPSMPQPGQPGRPMVSKKAAGPGQSSQNWQDNGGSTLPDLQWTAQSQLVTCLPTPPIVQSKKQDTKLSTYPSVSRFETG
jgi:hypothetical protein